MLNHVLNDALVSYTCHTNVDFFFCFAQRMHCPFSKPNAAKMLCTRYAHAMRSHCNKFWRTWSSTATRFFAFAFDPQSTIGAPIVHTTADQQKVQLRFRHDVLWKFYASTVHGTLGRPKFSFKVVCKSPRLGAVSQRSGTLSVLVTDRGRVLFLTTECL